MRSSLLRVLNHSMSFSSITLLLVVVGVDIKLIGEGLEIDEGTM